jgi:NAD(P)-dependent dehydrogenase (short-subunit alcohol dehydrogenase family)
MTRSWRGTAKRSARRNNRIPHQPYPCGLRSQAQPVLPDGRIEILVNNAGINGPIMPMTDYPPADWDRVIAVDLTSVFPCGRDNRPAPGPTNPVRAKAWPKRSLTTAQSKTVPREAAK